MEQTQRVTSVRPSVLEKVLEVVRELGTIRDLPATLDLICGSIVEVLEYQAATINVLGPDARLTVTNVAGPPEVQQLLGKSGPLALWEQILEAAQVWGNLRFVSHTADQTALRGPLVVGHRPAAQISTQRIGTSATRCSRQCGTRPAGCWAC